MEFREIRIEDKNWITSLRDTTRYPLTAYAFTSLYTWRNDMGLTVAGDEHCFVIHCASQDGYFYPCGEEEACRDYVTQLMNKDKQLKLFYLGEEQKEQARSLGLSVSCDRDSSEYIYDWSTFAQPTQGNGHCIHDKVRKFSRNTDYTIRQVIPQDKEILSQITKEWGIVRQETADVIVTLDTIKRMEELDVEGILLESKEDRAFSLGYRNTPDIYTFSMVKYTKGFNADVIAVCAHEMAKAFYGHGQYIDLEEDMGHEGMRRMKMAYHPAGLLDSYKAVFP